MMAPRQQVPRRSESPLAPCLHDRDSTCPTRKLMPFSVRGQVWCGSWSSKLVDTEHSGLK